jgi:DNA ligase-1
MMRREFLQLADTFKKHKIAGHHISEKLDGTRCFWDGGISRGRRTEDVPWASILDPKTGERKTKIKPLATGLWSRYGNPIIAPDEFLDQLPNVLLDGELWAGRGNFQLCRSICGGDTPDPRFMANIQYTVYSAPSFNRVFQDGEIKNTNMLCSINRDAIVAWLNNCRVYSPCTDATFNAELTFLEHRLDGLANCRLHTQTLLSEDEATAREQMNARLDEVLSLGGEGVVLRNPQAVWLPKRHTGILKVKPSLDSEATIVGYTSGREGKTGRRLGGIGSLVVEWKGKRFQLSGMTDAEREFSTPTMVGYAAKHPDQEMPSNFNGKLLPLGTSVTFAYRERTDDGTPKEARYQRVRDVE